MPQVFPLNWVFMFIILLLVIILCGAIFSYINIMSMKIVEINKDINAGINWSW